MMSYLAEVVEVGGNGGKPFELDGTKNGAMVEQIWVWVGKNQVRGIKVWLTGGQYKEIGLLEGKVEKFKFEAGEHFTSLSLWTNGDAKETRLGGIMLKTSHSRKFFAHMEKDLNQEVPVDVASGICMGIKGRSESKIDRLGFMFINIIKSTELTSVEYPTLPQVVPEVNAREIKSMTYHNNTSSPQEYTLETSKKITKQSSWSVTGKLELTFDLQLKAGIPILLENTAGFGLKLGVEGTYAAETTEERMEHFTFPVQIPPHKTMDVDITVGEAKIELPFTGVVKISCRNGGVLEFKTSGTYKGVTYTSGDVAVNESDKNISGASQNTK